MYRIIGADGKEYGPITVDQLRAWINEGRANAETRVLREGSAEWVSLGSVPELADVLAQARPLKAINLPGPGSSGTALRTNQMAMAGMIFGIVAMTLGLCCCYGLPFNILGVIFSAIGISQINKQPEVYSGKAMAIAGLVLSILSFVIAAVMIILVGFTGQWDEIMRDMRNL